MSITVKATKNIDGEILRSLGLCEVVEKKEGEKKFTVEKYRANGKLQDGVQEGDEVELEQEALWRRGIYDEKSFNKKLGALFSEPKGLKKSKPETKKIEAKEMKLAKEIAETEEEKREEIEKTAAKEAKK